MKNYLSVWMASSIVMSSTGFAQVLQPETDAAAQIEQLLVLDPPQLKNLVASEKESLSSIGAALRSLQDHLQA